MVRRLSSAARAATAWFLSWLATADKNRRLAGACRNLKESVALLERQLERRRVEVERLEAESSELKQRLSMTEGKLDVARGQIDEMVGYQEVSRQWADNLAARFAAGKYRPDVADT